MQMPRAHNEDFRVHLELANVGRPPKCTGCTISQNYGSTALFRVRRNCFWRRNIRWLRRQKSLINSLSTHWGIGQYTKQYQTYWGQSLLVYFPSSGPLGKPWWSPIGNQGNHPLVLGQKSQCIRDIFSTFFSINSCFRSLVFFLNSAEGVN